MDIFCSLLSPSYLLISLRRNLATLATPVTTGVVVRNVHLFEPFEHLVDCFHVLRIPLPLIFKNLCQVELVTMARFFDYTFDPASFYYCYDNTDALKVFVLEVNNTFGKKHLYILDRDSEANKLSKLGYFDKSFTINRACHVQYHLLMIKKAYIKHSEKVLNPGYLDMRLVMYTNSSHPDDVSSENVTYKNNTPIQRSRKKLVATTLDIHIL
ncbi:hypothetical protein C2G38_2170095 [Gigaspora rosea]|uniref:Uncharacterized protein n=1 Tax=Gigaspora rosea TaxID=44941 RepID=A0A397VRC0_9GLOM|nr:hypothetical protein C2G38_2170095 [Gigaspora rosea]